MLVCTAYRDTALARHQVFKVHASSMLEISYGLINKQMKRTLYMQCCINGEISGTCKCCMCSNTIFCKLVVSELFKTSSEDSM